MNPLTCPVAELRDVTRRFGPVRALDRVTLAIRPGQLTAVLGPNGAGKTTAIRLLLGLTAPSSGEVRLFGADPADRRVRMRVGVMLQAARLPGTLTPREHLALFRSYYPSPWPLDDLLATAGIADVADRRFGALSGGQRQRVLFALAVCGNPALVFLDEPTSGLDVEARHLLWDAVQRLVRDGRSIVLTTHNLEEADALADRVVVLHHGRTVADGTPARIKSLVAARRVRCVTSIAPDEMARVPGVQAVRAEGGALVALTADAETLARFVLARDAAVSDLEITGAGLEEAFISLTSGSARTGEEPAARPLCAEGAVHGRR